MNGRTIVRELMRKFFIPESYYSDSFSIEVGLKTIKITSFHNGEVVFEDELFITEIFASGEDLISISLKLASHRSRTRLTPKRVLLLKVGDEVKCKLFDENLKVSGKVKLYKKFPKDFAFPARLGNVTYWVGKKSKDNKDLGRFLCNKRYIHENQFEFVERPKKEEGEYLRIEVQ
jgi:hypothetical protein